MFNDLQIVRVIFVLLLTLSGLFLKPFGLGPLFGALAGLVFGLGVVFFEIRLKQVSLKRLIGAAIGAVLGIFGAYLMSLVIGGALRGSPRRCLLCSLESSFS
jgi:hypothetical protein